jgi:hypothetical protein
MTCGAEHPRSRATPVGRQNGHPRSSAVPRGAMGTRPRRVDTLWLALLLAASHLHSSECLRLLAEDGQAGSRELNSLTFGEYVRGKDKYPWVLPKEDLGAHRARGGMICSSMHAGMHALTPAIMGAPCMHAENGIAYLGAHERLRVAIDKVKQGNPIKVTTLGGSITGGQGAVDAPNWPQYMFNYLSDQYGAKLIISE